MGMGLEARDMVNPGQGEIGNALTYADLSSGTDKKTQADCRG
jgi:hypothetical protein